MSRYVLDSSVVLALVNNERGAALVREAIAADSVISAVNLAEVVAKLIERGASRDQVAERLAPLDLNIVEFGAALAIETGVLRTATRQAGLSLGDRACLALGQQLRLPVLTADRAWRDVNVSVAIQLIR